MGNGQSEETKKSETSSKPDDKMEEEEEKPVLIKGNRGRKWHPNV